MVARRRLTLALALLPLVSMAQQPAKIARIGVLGLANPNAYAAQLEAFRGGLKELGYVDGKNVRIDYRWADGQYDRLRDLAAELVDLEVDVIITHASGAMAAKSVTTKIPIVTYVGDMVSPSLAVSLSHPDGNVTGSSFLGPELTAKRLELSREAVPRLARVAFVRNPVASLSFSRINETMHAGARQLKIAPQTYDVKGPVDLADVFASLVKDRVEAIVLFDDPMLIANNKAIGELAIKHRLPAVGFTGFADAGALDDQWRPPRRTLAPGCLLRRQNIEGRKSGQPANRATDQVRTCDQSQAAKTIGFKIPQTLLQRADKLIERSRSQPVLCKSIARGD